MIDSNDLPLVRVDTGIVHWDPNTCNHIGAETNYRSNAKVYGTYCGRCGTWLKMYEETPLPLVAIQCANRGCGNLVAEWEMRSSGAC